jgi:1-acyl-sn-glycerol-3-phosphate acyltransferase
MAGVPILPTIIWGSQRVWTKDHPKRLGRSGVPIFLSVGEPIEVGRRDDHEQANALLVERMTALLHAAQDAYPPIPADELCFVPARLGGTAPTPERAAQLDADEAAAKAARRAARAGGTQSTHTEA